MTAGSLQHGARWPRFHCVQMIEAKSAGKGEGSRCFPWMVHVTGLSFWLLFVFRVSRGTSCQEKENHFTFTRCGASLNQERTYRFVFFFNCFGLCILIVGWWFDVVKGCTSYLTDSARNISGSDVGATVGVWELCRQWGPKPRVFVPGQGVRGWSPPDDVLLMQQQNFRVYSHVYAEIQQ